jgi:hypothetical protein
MDFTIVEKHKPTSVASEERSMCILINKNDRNRAAVRVWMVSLVVLLEPF